MLFSSIVFLYAFLPIVLIGYYILPKKMRNHFLMIASLVFYFFGEQLYVLLLLFSALSDWLHAVYIENHRGSKGAKRALISSIVINLSMLGFFKYIDFFISNINLLVGCDIPLTNVPLPLGISFFTFQTMSYTIDVYRGKAHARKDFSTMLLYVSLFPQLVAGPIVRYTDLEQELDDRQCDTDNVAAGIRRFSVGLAKKVLIANSLGELCKAFRAAGEVSVTFYWLYAVAFSLQIYFDFSAYSDMAIGMGKMFGFKFPENFNYPFISKSITEFWRRWHMSLGSWFRDYVYIPLGGNRVSKIKWLRNIAIVWILTGFWHGAAWNFVLWGAFFGVMLILEKLFWLKKLEKSKVISHVYLLFLVLLSFVLFNADGLHGAVSDFRGMFGLSGLSLINAETIYYLKSYAVTLILAIIGATPLCKQIYWRFADKKIMVLAEPLAVGVFLLLATASLIDGSFNPFLYFRF